jgi:YHS domain-containing protein
MRTGANGLSATYDGDTYRFCSKSCKRTFERDPDRFADEPPTVEEAMSGHTHH